MLQPTRPAFIARALAAALPALALAACQQRHAQVQQSPARPEVTVAMARVINAIPGEAKLDVVAGEAEVFSNVAYESVTPYRPVPTRGELMARRELTPQGPSTGVPVGEGTKLAAGQRYTLIAAPSDDPEHGVELKAVTDDTTAPATGKARVRIINAAPDAESLDVYAGGKELASVGFGDSYREIDPPAAPLELRVEGENGRKETVRVADPIESGDRKTLVLVAKVAGRLNVVSADDTSASAAPSADH